MRGEGQGEIKVQGQVRQATDLLKQQMKLRVRRRVSTHLPYAHAHTRSTWRRVKVTVGSVAVRVRMSTSKRGVRCSGRVTVG